MNPPQNEMMDRPIVQADVLNFMRNGQRQFTGELLALQEFANAERVPIIPHETAVFLDFIICLTRPERILEVGTAIGFSAGVMIKAAPDTAHIWTIDRFRLMSDRADANFQKLGVADKVTLIAGDASFVLPDMCRYLLDGNVPTPTDDKNHPEITQFFAQTSQAERSTQTEPSEHANTPENVKFDLIFLDCAKSKYIEFLPYCLRLLSDTGLIIIDDVFQAGTIFDDPSLVRHKRRKIYEGLNALLTEVNTNPDLIATSLPLGDGLLLIQKQGKSNEH